MAEDLGGALMMMGEDLGDAFLSISVSLFLFYSKERNQQTVR